MLAFLEMRNGGDRMARGSVGTGRGRTMGPAQAPSPDRRCSSLFANQVGVRLLPARANLRGWARLLTPQKLSFLRTLEPDLELPSPFELDISRATDKLFWLTATVRLRLLVTSAQDEESERSTF